MKIQEKIAKTLNKPTELTVPNTLSKHVTATGSTSAVNDPHSIVSGQSRGFGQGNRQSSGNVD